MIASANDGANLLAEYFGGGTIEGGVAAMNAQVQALGLEHTHFANPTASAAMTTIPAATTWLKFCDGR